MNTFYPTNIKCIVILKIMQEYNVSFLVVYPLITQVYPIYCLNMVSRLSYYVKHCTKFKEYQTYLSTDHCYWQFNYFLCSSRNSQKKHSQVVMYWACYFQTQFKNNVIQTENTSSTVMRRLAWPACLSKIKFVHK